MPDRDVKTIQDAIFFQYAKVIACSSFGLANGQQAKKQHYGFIKNKFKQLCFGQISWSEITREDWQFVEARKQCAYCGCQNDLQKEHIVHKSLRLGPRCPDCDTIQGIHNQVWACGKCNGAKGTKGLYEFYKARMPDEKKFYDFVPHLLEKKYLKTIYNCHKCAGTLDKGDLDGDGQITVLDIDFILRQT
jgi:ribosomal protein S27AE